MYPRVKDYPKRVLINGETWDVGFRKMDDEGLCDPSERRIWIQKGLRPRERLKCFIHELLHALGDEYDIDIPHKLVYKLETPIVDFICENSL